MSAAKQKKSAHPYFSPPWIAERIPASEIKVGYNGKKSVHATVLGAFTEIRPDAHEQDVIVYCAIPEKRAAVEAEVRRLLELEPKERANVIPFALPALPVTPGSVKPAAAKPKGKGRKVSFVRASDVEPENVDWLWDGYLARGSMTILTGDTGLLKSQIAISLIASITKTGKWPDGTKAPSGSAVILGSEDSLRMTTRPRLEAAGADSERVACLSAVTNADGTANTFSVQQDLEALAAVIEGIGDVALIVIDPITRSAFPWFEFISGGIGELVGPSVDDGMAIDVVDTGHDALLEFLLRCHADVAQDRAGELGEEALDEVEPGAVLGGEGKLEAAGPVEWRPKLWFLSRCARNDCREST